MIGIGAIAIASQTASQRSTGVDASGLLCVGDDANGQAKRSQPSVRAQLALVQACDQGVGLFGRRVTTDI